MSMIVNRAATASNVILSKAIYTVMIFSLSGICKKPGQGNTHPDLVSKVRNLATFLPPSIFSQAMPPIGTIQFSIWLLLTRGATLWHALYYHFVNNLSTNFYNISNWLHFFVQFYTQKSSTINSAALVDITSFLQSQNIHIAVSVETCRNYGKQWMCGTLYYMR